MAAVVITIGEGEGGRGAGEVSQDSASPKPPTPKPPTFTAPTTTTWLDTVDMQHIAGNGTRQHASTCWLLRSTNIIDVAGAPGSPVLWALAGFLGPRGRPDLNNAHQQIRPDCLQVPSLTTKLGLSLKPKPAHARPWARPGGGGRC